MNESGTMQFMHPDHLGSTSLITDSAGNTVEETTYYPFGLTLSGGSAESKLYTGQELDGTDLYYYGARYYNPSLRSFVQPDPIIANVYNPQNLNRYSYVLNNPYKYVDPDGEFVLTALLVAGIAYETYSGYRMIDKIVKDEDTSDDWTKFIITSGATGLLSGFFVPIRTSIQGAMLVSQLSLEAVSFIPSTPTPSTFLPEIPAIKIPDTQQPSVPDTRALIEYENEMLRQASRLRGDLRKISKALNKIKDIEKQYKGYYGKRGYKEYWKESEAYEMEKKLKDQRRKLRNERKRRLLGY